MHESVVRPSKVRKRGYKGRLICVRENISKYGAIFYNMFFIGHKRKCK